ncbi:MAG: hypothetical protein HC914_14730 [Chloroflexaceae bacterium]|nr:hypothetical protein [Chloroflexaceae bacterium]
MDRSLQPVAKPQLALIARYILGHRRNLPARIALLISDQLLIVLGFWMAYQMRYRIDWPEPFSSVVREVATANFVQFSAFLPITLLLVVVLSILFITRGLYRQPPGTSFLDYTGIILSSTLTAIALLIVIVFLYRPFFYSRLIFAFAGINIIVLLAAWRLLLLLGRRWLWANGIGQEHVLVIGGNRLAQQVMDGIRAQPDMGYRLVGYLEDALDLPPPAPLPSGSARLTTCNGWYVPRISIR